MHALSYELTRLRLALGISTMRQKLQQNVTRRQLVAGAGTVGALAAAAAVVQLRQDKTAEPASIRATPPHGGGYRLSEHVLRYYQTARV